MFSPAWVRRIWRATTPQPARQIREKRPAAATVGSTDEGEEREESIILHVKYGNERVTDDVRESVANAPPRRGAWGRVSERRRAPDPVWRVVSVLFVSVERNLPSVSVERNLPRSPPTKSLRRPPSTKNLRLPLIYRIFSILPTDPETPRAKPRVNIKEPRVIIGGGVWVIFVYR